MAFTHGKDAVLWLDNVAGTLTDISAFVDAVSGLPGMVEQGETTTYGKEDKTYIPGLGDATITIGGKWDPTLDAVFGAKSDWQAGSRSFEQGPAGGASGAIKYSGEANIQNYVVNAPVGDVVTWSATLQCTDAVTRGTFT